MANSTRLVQAYLKVRITGGPGYDQQYKVDAGLTQAEIRRKR